LLFDGYLDIVQSSKYDALVCNVLSRGKCRDYGHISPSWQSFLLSSM